MARPASGCGSPGIFRGHSEPIGALWVCAADVTNKATAEEACGRAASIPMHVGGWTMRPQSWPPRAEQRLPAGAIATSRDLKWLCATPDTLREALHPRPSAVR